jgi:hypothetical protein
VEIVFLVIITYNKIIDGIFQCLGVAATEKGDLWGESNRTYVKILLNCFIVDRMIRFFIKGRLKHMKAMFNLFQL